MEIPPILIEQIRQGQVVLFLGSGAIVGAKHPKFNSPPIGNELAKMLCDKFLSKEFYNRQLSDIADLAISETSLVEVQSFIAEIFNDFEPADFHKLIPSFVWRGIITTNYDLVIEKAYQQISNRMQSLVVFKKDTERVEKKIKNQDDLIYIKLHGCITDIYDPDFPLIITTDQYINHKDKRKHLFQRYLTLSYDFPFVFVGQSLLDPDLRAIMLELDQLKTAKPRSYLVNPNLTDADIRFWTNKKITHINLSFSDFLNNLNNKIPAQFRKLSTLLNNDEHPLIKKYGTVNNSKFSENLITLLERDVEYISSFMKIPSIDPKVFYKGFFNNFAPILNNLDVKRRINDIILSEVFLVDEEMKREIVEFYIILGHAGSGKTVSLKRIAWDATVSFDKLCLYAAKNTYINYEVLYELFNLTKERIFLFIDPVLEYSECIVDIIIKAKKDNMHITIIGCERKNEWNTNGNDLKIFVNEFYEMKYLSEKEIGDLINLLSIHKSLGHLEGLSFEKQKDELSQRAGRQILVALYEATLGKPFTNIILDEYNSIPSPKAQSLYLTICILHRLGVPVRAGLISRVHGISFSEFQDSLFQPLEDIVFISKNETTKDYYYQSRHPQIAEIVFTRVLTTPQNRFDEYMRILESLDLGYSSDYESFKELMKGKQLLELFPDPMMVRQLFEYAESIKSDDPMLFQQEAIFEMTRNSGNIVKAEKLLEKAYNLAPNNRAIAHSLSIVEYEKSKRVFNSLEKNKYRSNAKKIAQSMISSTFTTSHPYHTIISINIDELEEIIEEGDQSSIERKIKDLEKTINDSLQKFPGDPYLLDAESKYALLLNENPKARQSLIKAFENNKRSSYLASRLSHFYENEEDGEKAISILKECVEANPSDKNANYRLAYLLMKYDEDNYPDIKFHLRRSFTDGDSNYIAQFSYARIIYTMNEFEEATKIFKILAKLNIDSRIKKEIRANIKTNSQIKRFTGAIIHLESSYCFISRDGTQDNIYSNYSNSKSEDWEKLRVNDRISFSIGFNYHGAVGFNVKKL